MEEIVGAYEKKWGRDDKKKGKEVRNEKKYEKEKSRTKSERPERSFSSGFRGTQRQSVKIGDIERSTSS